MIKVDKKTKTRQRSGNSVANQGKSSGVHMEIEFPYRESDIFELVKSKALSQVQG